MSHVIGIDIGTSGIKIGAMDEHGQLAFVLHETYSLQHPKTGWVEINPDEVWVKVHSLLKRANEDLQLVSGSIDALSISTFCNAMIVMDANGEALIPGILYLDRRSEQEARWMRSVIGEELQLRLTGNRIEPGMISVTSLLWVKRHKPELFNRMHTWGHLSSYISHKLTGRFALDWTQASYTGIFDIGRYEWLPEHCQLLGIPDRSLPDLIAPYEVLGKLSNTDLVALLGDIPVIAGAADTACSALAVGLQPGDVFESVGTSDVLTVCRDQPTGFDNRFLNRCHITKNQWLSHGAMSTPGACIQWFCHTFLGSDDVGQGLMSVAASSSPGANGVFFLPYLHGERTPIWDVNAKGVFTGINLNTSKADLLQSIYEGCFFGLRQIYDIIHDEYGLRPVRLRTVGGGVRNSDWMQIKAHVLDTCIEVLQVTQTAVSGACLLAAGGAGYTKSLWDPERLSRSNTVRTYFPDRRSTEQYERLYQLFSRLYPAMQSFFKEASLVQADTCERT